MTAAAGRRTAAAPEPATSPEQVLVAEFPGDDVAEVYIARLDVAAREMNLREASVKASGGVTVGGERIVSLTGANFSSSGNTITLRGPRDNTLVELHFETSEDEQRWSELIRAVLVFDAAANGDANVANCRTEEEEVAWLQARSQQLQSRLGLLDTISNRRDKQLMKMLGRIDGATQMLTAVQDMCNQQTKVIESQRTAIAELHLESNDEHEEQQHEPLIPPSFTTTTARTSPSAATGRPTPAPKFAAAPAVPLVRRDEEDEDDDDGDDAAAAQQAEQMIQLLAQADEMQRFIQDLKSLETSENPSDAADGIAALLQGVNSLSAGVAHAAGSPQAAGTAQGRGGLLPPEPPSQAVAERMETDAECQESLAKLRELEAEKARFEAMLNDSQDEHQQLLGRLGEMRSLMSALGLKEEDMDLSP